MPRSCSIARLPKPPLDEESEGDLIEQPPKKHPVAVEQAQERREGRSQDAGRIRCQRDHRMTPPIGPWTIQHGRLQRDAWPVALAGLGRELCGASLNHLTERLEVSNSTVSKLCRLHDQEMQRGGEYSVRSARLAHVALQGWGGV